MVRFTGIAGKFFATLVRGLAIDGRNGPPIQCRDRRRRFNAPFIFSAFNELLLYCTIGVIYVRVIKGG